MKNNSRKQFMKLLCTLAFAIAMMSFPAAAQAAIYWPVPGHTRLSQGFHDGCAIDINDGSIAGAKVVAAMGGKVTHVFKCTQQHLNYGDCNGFGTGVVIQGDDGRIYQYAHMQAGSIPSNVYVGARVASNQMIGRVGTTGYSTGNHLHFGISLGKYWNKSGIDPTKENYLIALNVSWNTWASNVTNTNAKLNAKFTVSQRVGFTGAGITIWDEKGNVIASKNEKTAVNNTYMNIWYDVNSELGKTLTPGTRYYYQIYADFGGKRYYCGKTSFQTTGTKPAAKHYHSYSGWTTVRRATVFTTGLMQRTCSCKAKETKAIPKLTPTISVSASKVTLKRFRSTTVSVRNLAYGDRVSEWSTSNKKVATVSSSGRITAKAKGSAKITVTLLSGKKAVIYVTVK